MAWIDRALDQLAARPVRGYRAEGPPATEPTACAAWALAVHGRWQEALVASRWLIERQTSAGAAPVHAGQDGPAWTTALAVLAWRALEMALPAAQFGAAEVQRASLRRGVRWLLTHGGAPIQPHAHLAHNSQLIGWSWVKETHSWVEPTALAVWALRATGQGGHARTQEGTQLLLDRLLPAGGCNYGNTMVLGNMLRPHVLPTGLTLAAMPGVAMPDKAEIDGRLEASRKWLRGQLGPQTPAVSLSFGLLGLLGQGQPPAAAAEFLAAAYERVDDAVQGSFAEAALVLAAAGERALLYPGAVLA